ncbi:hypothetical protein Scep_016024 [Stephania cephalantha]|uniref:Peptidase A1 domain-containing protein n=1 Tax=Stephania cephalantha TaxID=152367 RepID=A0AAP0INJ2_9MAGN
MAIVQALLISLTILLFPLLFFKTNDKVPLLMLPIKHRDDTNPSLALLPIISGNVIDDSKGYLALGRSTTSSSTATKYTPIIKDPSQPSRNFIHFIGISIDGRKLPIDPSILNSPGTILDTGTPITRLPAKAYTVLRDSFRRLMAAYPLGEKDKTLDTCYLITEERIKQIPLPKIVMHFKDVDVEVHRSGILVKTKKGFCLAFSAKRDEGTPGIIGNKQQSTYEVVYDLDGEKIGFRPNGCS